MNPKDVYDSPENYLDFLTTHSDDKFEGQFFDRKQFSHRSKTTAAHVQKTVSAFANSNREGGLLILGISGEGAITGVKSFSEELRNSCTNLNNLLISHAASVKAFDCVNERGESDEVILIFSDYVNTAICSSHEDSPKSWVRSGSQNVVMSPDLLDAVKRQKGISNFELTICTQFELDEVDLEIVEKFTSENHMDEFGIRDRLYNLGAIVKKNDNYYFTNSGYLFFTKNPQRRLIQAKIRLAKFEVEISDWKDRGLPTFEKSFDGPLSKQILKIRAYLRESGFFKIYKHRKLGGGFVDEPEYPENAIDEAIVNAVAHRDYAISLPIECIKYIDSFYIENPGTINQRDKTLPNIFTLDEKTLVSTPFNSNLVDWLKQIKDDAGSSFVQKWGEGTKTIKKSVNQLKLPSPEYRTSIKATSLTLRNNYIEREAKIRQLNNINSDRLSEYLNIFKIKIY